MNKKELIKQIYKGNKFNFLFLLIASIFEATIFVIISIMLEKVMAIIETNELSELYKQKSYDTTVFNEKKNKIKMQMLNFQQKYDVVQKQFNKLNHMTQLKQRTKAAVESNHLEEKFKQIVNYIIQHKHYNRGKK